MSPYFSARCWNNVIGLAGRKRRQANQIRFLSKPGGKRYAPCFCAGAWRSSGAAVAIVLVYVWVAELARPGKNRFRRDKNLQLRRTRRKSCPKSELKSSPRKRHRREPVVIWGWARLFGALPVRTGLRRCAWLDRPPGRSWRFFPLDR